MRKRRLRLRRPRCCLIRHCQSTQDFRRRRGVHMETFLFTLRRKAEAEAEEQEQESEDDTLLPLPVEEPEVAVRKSTATVLAPPLSTVERFALALPPLPPHPPFPSPFQSWLRIRTQLHQPQRTSEADVQA